jgi:4a-hydroxytetrahydrobiopterin dehydratase
MAAKLDRNARDAALKELKGWSHDAKRDAIAKTFVFADFVEAFGFMTKAALVAERLQNRQRAVDDA